MYAVIKRRQAVQVATVMYSRLRSSMQRRATMVEIKDIFMVADGTR